MKRKMVFILFLIASQLFAQDKRMCITIDDLPMIQYGIKTEGHDVELTEGILNALKVHKVPAIGYVNEGKLYVDGKPDPERVSYLERWLEEGFELGNHTYSHMNYHRSDLEKFGEDILKGDKIIKPLSKKYGKEVRFFRHPYLRSGSSRESSDALKQFLRENNYTEAPVTIDNEEYLFAKAYAEAYKEGDSELMKKVGRSYLEYMEAQLEYYEKASMDLLGRNIDHTLLIHANYLNAVYLDALLIIIENRGYTFISQEEVLKDPAYDLEVTSFGDWGISWIHRWGLSKGLKGEFFEGEARTPGFIRELSSR